MLSAAPLPGPFGARINGLDLRQPLADDTMRKLPAAGFRDDGQRARAPECRHPLVRAHPVTGRKALYAVAGTSRRIEGTDPGEGLALPGELKALATDDVFVHAHRHAVGDIAIWDTAATLHKAEVIAAATGPGDSRLLYRISVKGRPRLA